MVAKQERGKCCHQYMHQRTPPRRVSNIFACSFQQMFYSPQQKREQVFISKGIIELVYTNQLDGHLMSWKENGFPIRFSKKLKSQIGLYKLIRWSSHVRKGIFNQIFQKVKMNLPLNLWLGEHQP